MRHALLLTSTFYMVAAGSPLFPQDLEFKEYRHSEQQFTFKAVDRSGAPVFKQMPPVSYWGCYAVSKFLRQEDPSRSFLLENDSLLLDAAFPENAPFSPQIRFHFSADHVRHWNTDIGSKFCVGVDSKGRVLFAYNYSENRDNASERASSSVSDGILIIEESLLTHQLIDRRRNARFSRSMPSIVCWTLAKIEKGDINPVIDRDNFVASNDDVRGIVRLSLQSAFTTESLKNVRFVDWKISRPSRFAGAFDVGTLSNIGYTPEGAIITIIYPVE